ncbi:protein kinase domain-containing protein [Actinomycetospora sp. CA-101289]|uniref:protein kinase domain-containing protein n=1 Tax=Actinomycetospora sp. CA-101289 TaxID=3239893 RepID=UPI003D952BD3
MTEQVVRDPSIPAVPGYRDLVRIGQGGFAAVYRAHRETFGQVVAIKLAWSWTIDDAARLRFDRECRAMGGLAQHPHIVTVYDAGVLHDGSLFLVMEYLSRGSYGPWVGRMAAHQVVDVGVKLAGALASAHHIGILHRDVKPENVLISPYGEPLLADFGIARVAGRERTESGVVTASLAYAAPEVLDGEPPSPAADLYCLAATLFTLLTGRPPFSRPGDSASAMISRIMREPVPDLRRTGLPPRLCATLEAAMAKHPHHRSVDVLAFANRLREVQHEQGWPLSDPVIDPGTTRRAGDLSLSVLPPRGPTVVGPWPPASSVATIGPGPESPLPRVVPPVRHDAVAVATGPPPGRRLWWKVLAAAVVLIVAATVVTVISTSQSDPATEAAGTITGPGIAVGRNPQDLVEAGGHLWTANKDDGTLSDIDPVSGAVRSIQVGGQPNGLAVDGTGLWVWNFDDSVVRVDTTTGAVGPVVSTSPRISMIVSGGGSIWLTHREANTVTRIDAGTGRVLGAPIPVGPRPIPAWAGPTQLYVMNSGDSTISRIGLDGGQALPPPMHLPCGGGLMVDDGTIYVGCSERSDTGLQVIDERTYASGPAIPVPGAGVFYVRNHVLWVTFPFAGTLARYDAPAGRPLGQPIVGIGRGVESMTVAADGTVWLCDAERNQVVHVQPS